MGYAAKLGSSGGSNLEPVVVRVHARWYYNASNYCEYYFVDAYVNDNTTAIYHWETICQYNIYAAGNVISQLLTYNETQFYINFYFINCVGSLSGLNYYYILDRNKNQIPNVGSSTGYKQSYNSASFDSDIMKYNILGY